MKIFIERIQKTIEREFSGKVKDLLKSVDINPNNVLVVRNNELITEEDDVKNSDSVKILSVISGG
ncbi:MAG: MoaD/ThiS family protein [Nanoarchaeota archaeon]|nr:MoaD/ThiS family protein [DPANN group archaeon]MBL7117091.1 MoaD/ThiS family protein [Nanoarchaeota archaeon]